MKIKELVEKGFHKKYLISDEHKEYIESGDLISKLSYVYTDNIVKITMCLYIFYDNSENGEVVSDIYVENTALNRKYSEEQHIELNYDRILNFDFSMFDKYLK